MKQRYLYKQTQTIKQTIRLTITTRQAGNTEYSHGNNPVRGSFSDLWECDYASAPSASIFINVVCIPIPFAFLLFLVTSPLAMQDVKNKSNKATKEIQNSRHRVLHLKLLALKI